MSVLEQSIYFKQGDEKKETDVIQWNGNVAFHDWIIKKTKGGETEDVLLSRNLLVELINECRKAWDTEDNSIFPLPKGGRYDGDYRISLKNAAVDLNNVLKKHDKVSEFWYYWAR